ncbi:hypothetical protein F9L33_14920 [Amylibacter sp. SFDW26]|uniref:hypothetical protein n=1 Tax=Amylibacter sp. SFDW26 TaxID=2652722 RepID=UPI001261F3E7|nr:hypothetical protein [Amylibacter sp. SFDW26]KAB7610183.1 hypothetical protein F9L33_14920 [Amylibacter sp. SFDW26]
MKKVDNYVDKIAHLQLVEDNDIIPEDGINSNRIRVEIIDHLKKDERRLSEVLILGELPWYRGEIREVILRVASDDFLNHIKRHHPIITVFRGPYIIGELKFIEKRVHSEMLKQYL